VILIAVSVVILDQLSKILIMLNMVEGQSVSVLGDFLNFQFIFNEGGAMGTRIGPSWIYTVLTLLALLLIIRYLLQERSQRISTGVALALITGGAVGNLIDRIIYGKVIDFIDVDIPDIGFLNIQRWFTFNVADAAITVGLAVFIVGLIVGENGRSEPDPEKSVA
jgi:signal peptidase II